jgi:hypothetical protein
MGFRPAALEVGEAWGVSDGDQVIEDHLATLPPDLRAGARARLAILRRRKRDHFPHDLRYFARCNVEERGSGERGSWWIQVYALPAK